MYNMFEIKGNENLLKIFYVIVYFTIILSVMQNGSYLINQKIFCKCLVCKKPFNINHNLLDKEDVAYILSFDEHIMSTYDLCCSDLKHNIIINCRNLVALIAFLMLGTIFFIILSTYS